MKQICVEVPQETSDYLYRLAIETAARQDNINSLLERHSKDMDAGFLDSPVFQAYQTQHAQYKAEHELAAKELEKKYIPKALYGKHQYTWNLDYQTCLMTIDVQCDCGVKALETGE